MFASELLTLLGHGVALKAQLGIRSEKLPANDVDRELLVKLRAAHTDGSLAAELKAWRLDTAAVKTELLALAATSSIGRKTEVDPLLSEEGTPLLFDAFKGLLFVRLAHNLLLESYVSRLATLEKTHRNTHALTLDDLFMYKARQADARAERLDASLRSASGGGLRPGAQARLTQRLSGSANSSKAQLLHLCSQVKAAASRYVTAALHKRKEGGLWQRLRATRDMHEQHRRNLAASHVGERLASCRFTPTGRRRKPPPTAIACIRLLGPKPAPGTIVKKGKGNFYKNPAHLKVGRAAMAAHSKELAGAAKKHARKVARMHGTGGQERRAADAAAKRQLPQPLRPGKRPRREAATAAAAAAAATAAEESEEEEDGEGGLVSDEDWDESDEEGEAAASEVAALEATVATLRSRLAERGAAEREAAEAAAAAPSGPAAAAPAVAVPPAAAPPAAAPPSAAPPPPPPPPPDAVSIRHAELRKRLKRIERDFLAKNGRKPEFRHTCRDIDQPTWKMYCEYMHLKQISESH